MATRRGFLAGLLASGAAPGLGWADVGGPTHLSAAKTPLGDFVLTGLRDDGSLAFQLPLPARGHAAAAHPQFAEAVAFARRPGTFAMVIDCARGRVAHEIVAPRGHHFYGHGAFSADGARLFTTENHIESGQGRIGIWSRQGGYTRIGETSSGGIGPHELLRIPGTRTLAVANGGILTRPETGREKLNLNEMRPNLTCLSEDGEQIAQWDLPPDLHHNSLRHIAAASDGTIACAFQWQGDIYDAPPLLALCSTDSGLRFASMPDSAMRNMAGYAGSVAVLGDNRIALSSPVGGVAQIFDSAGRFESEMKQADLCGVAATATGGLATDGLGGVHRIADRLSLLARHDLAFDNHLVAIRDALG